MIEKIRLRGFTGIKRGMLLDEIEIDFTGREGLLAFDGENGAGKTSVLDHLHPFDCLASREGALKNHCYLRDSLKELTFTHNGHHYFTRIKIDAESGKSEGFAFVDGSEKSVTSGSITEYHKWAVRAFGSTELFFASIIKAQNSDNISDMTVGTLKGLFAEFLRLERYEKWADTAKQAGNVVQGKVGALDNRISTLNDALLDWGRVELEYAEAGSKAENLRDDKTVLEHAVAEKRRQIDALKETINKNALALERKRDIQKQLDRLEGELAKEKAAATGEISILSEKYKTIKQDITYNDGIMEARGRIEEAAARQRDLENSLIALQADIDRLTEERAEHQVKVHEAGTEIAKLRTDRKALDSDAQVIEAGRELADLTFQLTGAKQALETLKNDKSLLMADGKIIVAKEKMQSLGLKDPACVSSTCAFIIEALKAQATLPTLEVERDRVRDELDSREEACEIAISNISECAGKAKGKLNDRQAEIKGLQANLDIEIKEVNARLCQAQQAALDTNQFLTENRETIAMTREEITQLVALADKLPEIQVAEARKADLEKQLAEVMERGQEKKLIWIDRENALKLLMQKDRERLDVIAIDPFVEDTLVATQTEIKEIETVKLPALENGIQAARDKIAALQAELKRIEAAGKELTEAQEQKIALTLKVSRWRYLQNACGKNGLQALEIDGAAPLIAARANELLHMGYGPLFSIRIDTQDAEGREDLDIKVLSEFGEDSIKQKSGGERVWLLQPIRLAMTLLAKDKSGRSWDYACFDELTGALDSKGASTGFMSMYAPFMALGGMKQVFFITHQAECLNYADHILSFEKGKSPRWG